MNTKYYSTGSLLIMGTLAMQFCMESKPEESLPADGSWEILESDGSPSARHENSFVEVDDKFYLLGGRGI